MSAPGPGPTTDGRRYTAEEIAAEGGVPEELTRRLWRAMGFADVPDGDAEFTAEDLDALQRTGLMMRRDGLAPSDVLHLARVLGQSSARMAESVVAVSTERLAPAGPASLDPQVLEEIDHLIVYLLNRHLLDALRRQAGETLGPPQGAAVAVGFADMVGFTRLSQRLDDVELSALVEEFEAIASDTVVVNGGRVVKMIGDEVMWTSPDPAAAVEIALLLAEALDDADLPGVRVGLAAGPVVTRAGDLFGPTVNLAARATAIARPKSVLVAAHMSGLIDNDGRYEFRRLRPRRLKGIGVAELSVVSRAR